MFSTWNKEHQLIQLKLHMFILKTIDTLQYPKMSDGWHVVGGHVPLIQCRDF